MLIPSFSSLSDSFLKRAIVCQNGTQWWMNGLKTAIRISVRSIIPYHSRSWICNAIRIVVTALRRHPKEHTRNIPWLSYMVIYPDISISVTLMLLGFHKNYWPYNLSGMDFYPSNVETKAPICILYVIIFSLRTYQRT